MLICLVSTHHPCELLISSLAATHGLTSPCYNSASSRFLILHHEQPFILVIQNRLCACCGRLGHRFGCNLEIPLYGRYQRRAVFFLLFLIFTILVALPVQLAEFYIGRTGGKNAIDSFKVLRPGSQWPWVGRMGVAACFILLSFYSVVGGWVLNYVVHSFTGEIHVGADFKALFENTISSPFGSLFYQGCSC